MDYLNQVLLNGLFLSGLYTLVSLGVTLIFGVIRVGDLAQGALYAVSGYLVFGFMRYLDLPYGLAAPMAVACVIALSVLQGHCIYRPLQRIGIGSTFLGAIGLLVIVQNSLALGFTWDPQALSVPWDALLLQVGGATLPLQKLVVFGVAVFAAGAVWWFLNRTSPGMALRALTQNAEAAMLLGVNASAITALAFAIAGCLSGAAGALMAAVWPLTPYAGALLIVKAFAIAIIAKGRIQGALLAAFMVGLSESLVQAYWSAQVSDLIPFALLALLLLRPKRLAPEEDAPEAAHTRRRASATPGTRGRILHVLGWVLLVALPLLFAQSSSAWLHIFIVMGLNILLVSGLDLLTGYTGIPSLAQAGLWGLGAYASALIAMHTALPFPVTLLGAVLITLSAALIIGALGLRLNKQWTSFTFLVGIVMTLLIANLGSLTGGTQGLVGIPQLAIGLPDGSAWTVNPFRNKLAYLYLVMGSVLLGLWVKHRIVHCRIGRALLAIREDERLAGSIGIPTLRYKLFAFLMSAAFAGVAGSLYAHYLVYLNPDQFTFTQSFNLFVMNLIGGAASLWGPVAGPAALTLFDEIMRPINGAIGEITYGVALILVLIYLPGGCIRALRNLARWRLPHRSWTHELALEVRHHGAVARTAKREQEL